MNHLLARMDWPALFGQLLDQAGPDLLTTAAAMACNARHIAAAPATLAVLVTGSRPGHVVQAIADHTTVPAGVMREWLTATSRLVLAVLQPDPQPRLFPDRRPCYVDQRLPHLPLLGQAQQHAELNGRRLWVGYTDDLGPAIAGRCLHDEQVLLPDGQCTRAAVVEISSDEAQPVPVWLHELGHLLDPGHEPRSPEEKEAYADQLAARLASLDDAHALSLAELQLQAERVYIQVRTHYASSRQPAIEYDEPAHPAPLPGLAAELPAPGIDSLIAFNTLPLLAR